MDSSLVPATVFGGHLFVRVDGGEGHTCALTRDGQPYCWGNPTEMGHVGAKALPPQPETVTGSPSFVMLGVRAIRTCGLTADGLTYCWGDGTGYGSPTALSGPVRPAKLSTGDNGACGVTAAGQAYCSGDNQFGELGDSNPVRLTSSYVPVYGGLTWDSLAMGNIHACGVATGGAVYCWGNNSQGQVGADTSVTGSWVPVLLPGGLRFRLITAGAHHTCGLTIGGDAYCWGYNYFGQLGASTTEMCPGLAGIPVPCSHLPVRVSGSARFIALEAGDWHTCGLTSRGDLWCWGANLRGELGDGTLINRSSPVLVSSVAATFGVSAASSPASVTASADHQAPDEPHLLRWFLFPNSPQQGRMMRSWTR
jgi:alpha-tubulin suppressor-like RCC1 family protein